MEGPIQEGFLEEGPEEECWNREPAAGWRPALKLRGKAWLEGRVGKSGRQGQQRENGCLLLSLGAPGRTRLQGWLMLWFLPILPSFPLHVLTVPQPQGQAQGIGFPTVTFLPP